MPGTLKRKDVTDTPRMKLARILYALLTNPFGLTYREIMDRYEIHDERTLRDYLKELKRMNELVENGKQLIQFSGRGETRRVLLQEPDSQNQNIGCQVISLYFALCLLRFLEGTKLEEQVKNIYELMYKGKIKNHLRYLDKKIHSINEWPKHYKNKSGIVQECIKALIYQKTLSVGYRVESKRAITQHELDIYTLLQYRNGLYLLAKSDKGDNVIMFAVERIVNIHMTGNSFHYPKDFNPEKYFDGAFGLFTSRNRIKVVVNFDKSLERIIKARTWHPSQKIDTLKDETLQLTMKVGDLTQVVPWVLGFGPLAKVIEPEELKNQIKDAIRDMSKVYRMK